MLFVISCNDKPNHLHVRLANREAHLEYAGRFADQMIMAGPYLDDAGDMTGSMLIMDFPDEAAALAFTEKDPYNTAGLFESVSVRAWKKVIPA